MEPTDADPITYEERGHVVVVRINRPHRRNALNQAAVDGLRAAWERYELSDARCAVLTQSDPRSFCAGADLKDGADDLWEASPGLGVHLTKPVIAAVSGHCVGGGFILVQQCDLAIADETATFRYPEATAGITGGMIAGFAARVPAKIAMEFTLLGLPFEASRAAEIGMVNAVVPAGTAEERALEWAQRLADSAPLVVQTLKALVDETIPESPSETYARTRRALLKVRRSSDRHEGKAAFAEKRPPSFMGR